MPSNYEIPIVKPKRQSYEWYHPKGILKRNWILKHLHVLPAVIVLFQDLEWNDPQWTEKQYQCVSFMQTIKTITQVKFLQLHRNEKKKVKVTYLIVSGTTYEISDSIVTT